MVVFLGVGDLRQGVEAIQFFTRRYPRMAVIAGSYEENPEWTLALMRAGAAAYLLRPFTRGDLQKAAQKVARFLVAPAARGIQAPIISVDNPTGGTGTTTVAVNVAAALATEGSKVALIDLNLVAGDISTFLNVKPTYNLSSLTKNIERLDTNSL